MNRRFLFLVVLAAVGGLAACSTPPLESVVGEPVTAAIRNSPDAAAEVHKAVRRAAVRLGWRVAEETPTGMLLALEKGDAFARVRVEHDGTSYSLLPDEYNVRTPKFNQWIQNLNRKIGMELELANDVR